MAGTMKIQGMENVLKNLNAEIVKIQGRSHAGLIEAAILIRRDMEENEPKIPLDTGNLRASWFTTSFTDTKGPGMHLGFNANYAVWVHEMVDRKGGKPINWSRPGSGPKFLEAALLRNQKEILTLIRDNAKIK